jgi:hypothetical protein
MEETVIALVATLVRQVVLTAEEQDLVTGAQATQVTDMSKLVGVND